MNPRQFEEFVCEHFRQQGYKTELTTYSNDYGIEVLQLRVNKK